MKQLIDKLIYGDYFQYFNYPVRRQLIHYIKEQAYDKLEGVLSGLVPDPAARSLDLTGIEPVTILDERYPELLLQNYDPPLVLYCQGNTSLLNSERKIAIVGSRKPQEQSYQALATVLDSITPELTIVSGLALGIDGRSHQVALERGIPTIAVLGFGANYFYPIENRPLYQAICEQGLVISEYPPHIPINKWQFVARNRIIAGLCQVVVIIEAKAKSGIV